MRQNENNFISNELFFFLIDTLIRKVDNECYIILLTSKILSINSYKNYTGLERTKKYNKILKGVVSKWENLYYR